MSDNRIYRIKANVQGEDYVDVNVNLEQDIDVFEFLSLKIDTGNFYRLHTANYGCIVGRVLANNSVGIPNAKISIFIAADEETNADSVLSYLYPYGRVSDVNHDKIKYNLLPEERLYQCHQNVGTFPSKRMVLDDHNVFEIFDKYYKFTTTTNYAGDYMIFGVPVGSQMLHMDVDLSDIGEMLSQRPRDFLHKGYSITQFENANMFKKDTNLATLVQIFTQDEPVVVQPFWGDATEMGEIDSTGVRITRKDINLNYKFEPTCVFMGSLVTDEKSNGFTKSCIPTERMGKMDRITTGEGTIEMIRKTPNGDVEEYSVMGNQLIDGNGTWCYQIPMNLDYVRTDEYGNLVPTDDIERGMPTRARVRFRFSLNDFSNEYQSSHLVKMLVPNNPSITTDMPDNQYVFGTKTPETEFRDLFWNKVYSVKSYIPRLQKGNWNKDKRFSGIKAVNVNGNNNPIPYNNMRIDITFMFVLQCAIMHILIWAAGFVNSFMGSFLQILSYIGTKGPFAAAIDFKETSKNFSCLTIGDGACPDAEGWYFAPKCSFKTGVTVSDGRTVNVDLLQNTYGKLKARDGADFDLKDEKSINYENKDESSSICLTNKIDYFIQCIEMALAQEYEVIQFDFYNDWINGLLYMPRWFGRIRKKRTFLFNLIKIPEKVQACMEGAYEYVRNYTQQCALTYSVDSSLNVSVTTEKGCVGVNDSKKATPPQRCHKGKGRKFVKIKSGYVKQNKTSRGENVYYFKPQTALDKTPSRRVPLFETDIILLGSLSAHDIDGVPQTFKHLTSSSYQMPPNLAATNMDKMGRMYGTENGKSVCNGVLYEPIDENDRIPSMGEFNSVFFGRFNREPYYGNKTYYDYLIDVLGYRPYEAGNIIRGAFQQVKNKFLRSILYDKTLKEAKEIIESQNGEGSGLSAINDTFANYRKWGNGTDFADNGGLTDDDSEYEITEMAGIDWGYTGPGQGEPKYMSSLYQPGGHFLGIACFNAESNIKSCVNLSRVCEMGVSLSERHSVPKKKANGDDLAYDSYLVPTGLISKDEINDSNFRTEFATLNHNGLKVEKNPETDRYRYVFTPLIPTNFDGSLSSKISSGASPYNDLTGQDRQPEDKSYTDKEYTRTIERTSRDYYRFRMGIEDGGKAPQRYIMNQRRDELSLPIYNNSFYFYFGLHDGATALDRFYGDFYAPCPSPEKEWGFSFIVTPTHPCGTKTGQIEFFVDWGDDAIQELAYSAITAQGEVKASGPMDENTTSVSIGELGTGIYTIRFSADNFSYEANVTVPRGAFEWEDKINIEVTPFTKTLLTPNTSITEGRGYMEIYWDKSLVDFDNRDGGIDRIEIEYDGDDSPIVLRKNDFSGKTSEAETTILYSQIYLPSGNTDYSVKIHALCSTAGMSDITIDAGTYNCYMPYVLDAVIGNKGDFNATTVTFNGLADKYTGVSFGEEWWAAILSSEAATDEEKAFIELALTYRGSLYNHDEGRIDVVPVNGSTPLQTIISGGTGERLGAGAGNATELSLSNEEDSEFALDYRSFLLPTRNVPSGIGYKIIGDVTAKSDYNVVFLDAEMNRIPSEGALRLPSIYKPYFFRGIVFQDATTINNVTGDFSLCIANGLRYVTESPFSDIYFAGNDAKAAKYTAMTSTNWWQDESGDEKKFQVFVCSGQTTGVPSDYNVQIAEHSPNAIAPEKNFLKNLTFVGDGIVPVSEDVRYFYLKRVNENGEREKGDGSLDSYINAIKGGISGKMRPFKEDGNNIYLFEETAKEKEESASHDDFIYWSGSCTRAFKIPSGDDGFFMFNPSGNEISKTRIKEGDVTGMETSADCFVIGIYDNWTGNDAFSQICNPANNVNKYDYAGKDADALTVMRLYTADGFVKAILNPDIVPAPEPEPEPGPDTGSTPEMNEWRINARWKYNSRIHTRAVMHVSALTTTNVFIGGSSIDMETLPDKEMLEIADFETDGGSNIMFVTKTNTIKLKIKIDSGGADVGNVIWRDENGDEHSQQATGRVCAVTVMDDNDNPYGNYQADAGTGTLEEGTSEITFPGANKHINVKFEW